MPALDLQTGLRLHYLDIQPDGRQTVLMLHGLGANGSSWQLQFPALSDAGYRILAPDARGFGDSTYPPEANSIAVMAGDMAELVRRVSPISVHIVGISMGGTLALQIALNHPALVDKLVLVNTFARLRPNRPSDWFYLAVRFLLVQTLGLPAQARYVSQRLFPRPEQAYLREMLFEQITQADPKGYRAAMRALFRFNVESRLHEIRRPVLVITGAEDTTVQPGIQKKLASGIPGARHEVVPEAGHAISVECPDTFNQTLLDFLGPAT